MYAVWITGLPGSGKSAIAKEVKKRLNVIHLRLDKIRKQIVKEPKYTQKERDYVYREFANRGIKLVKQGKNVLYDATAHKKRYRNYARRQIPNFIEVYIRCPLKVCIERESPRKEGLVQADLYKKALERKKTGKRHPGLGKVIGVDVAYEVNRKAEIVIDSVKLTPKQAASKIVKYIKTYI